MNFAAAAPLETDFLVQSNGLAAVFIYHGADAGLLPVLQLTADCVAESFSGIRIFKADEVIDALLVGDFFSVLGKRETVPCLVLFHGAKFTLLPLATVSLPTCKRMVGALRKKIAEEEQEIEEKLSARRSRLRSLLRKISFPRYFHKPNQFYYFACSVIGTSLFGLLAGPFMFLYKGFVELTLLYFFGMFFVFDSTLALALHLGFSLFAYPLIRLALLIRGFSLKSAGEVRGRYIRALTVWA